MFNDPILDKLIIQYPAPHWTDRSDYLFEDLVDTIISQQLSGKAAESIFQRFKQLFSPLLSGEGPRSGGKVRERTVLNLPQPALILETTFPTPEQILALEQGSNRAIGVSNSKEQYIRNVAQAFVNNDTYIYTQ